MRYWLIGGIIATLLLTGACQSASSPSTTEEPDEHPVEMLPDDETPPDPIVGPQPIPAFPWPPPRASTMMNIEDAALRVAGDSTTLGQVDAELRAALNDAGYVDKSYFAVPDGFALVTRLEQIDDDGAPLDPPDRWSADAQPLREFNLGSIFRALFTANPGYFRIIVFAVTPHPFSQSEEEVNRNEAMAWLSEGLNRLPDSIARGRYTSAFRTTALVYEFEKPESSDAELVTAGRLTARDHLARSGLLNAIGMDVED